MLSYLPTLALRTRHTAVAVEVNGTLVGECLPQGHVALPVSDSGEYYIAVTPLYDDARRYYPIMRKLCFRDGVLIPPVSGDVEAYLWPGGVVEAVIAPGILPQPAHPSFPFTVDQLDLPDGCTATLYYEGGLRLAVEQGNRIRYGAMLCSGQTGRLERWKGGALVAISDEGPATLLALGSRYQELLRVQADEVDWRDSEAVCINRLPTMLGHEVRQCWEFQPGEGGGAFLPSEPKRGFFTHSPAPPQEGEGLLRAFCEAVCHGFYEEAQEYMTPSLQEGLNPETLREFLGNFIQCRTPLSNSDHMIGLCYPPEEGLHPVRVFSFSTQEGLIDDIEEV